MNIRGTWHRLGNVLGWAPISAPSTSFFKGTLLLSAALMLNACGDETPPDNTTSSSSVMNSSASSSLSSAPSSTTSSAANSSSSQAPEEPGPTRFSDFTPNATTGAQLYAASCAIGCHGPEGRDPNAISWARYSSPADFHDYIELAMPRAPLGNPSDCVGQCAADIAAYLWSVRPVEAACEAEDEVLFAQRALPLLSPEEYSNTITDLFAFYSSSAEVPERFLSAPSVNYVGSFPHTLRAQVSEDGSAKRLFDNAVGIAEWNALPGNRYVSCSSTNVDTCAEEFINGFARLAFRRPLKTEAEPGEALSEVAYFRRIFREAPDLNAGIKWAIAGALNAPQFVYRSELGIPASEALDNPLFQASAGAGDYGSTDLADYEAAGSAVTVNGVDFSVKRADGGGAVGTTSPDGTTIFNMYTNGTLVHTFSFSSPAMLTVRARGNDYNGTWPLMQLSVDGTLLAAEEVATPGYADDYRDYTYLVTGVSGDAQVSVYFGNDAGIANARGEPGTDIDLHVASVSVTPAKLKESAAQPLPTRDDFVDYLAAAANDSDAYVLDPYEFASVLSYMIVGSTPDPELLSAAESGALNSRAGVERQVDRLFASARAERHMKQFVSYWMQTHHLSKNRALGELDPEVDLRDLMVTELQEFFWHIVHNPDVPFEEFYTADYSFLNRRLAEHYGIVWNGNNENQFVKTPFSANDRRGGITTMGAFLAAYAHGEGSAPILRGVHVREDLLCQHIVPPGAIDEPEGVREMKQQAAAEAAASGTLTTRHYFEIATSSLPEAPLTGCGQCHYYDINPVGAALEDFDGFGRFREYQLPEGGQPGDSLIPIDASAGTPNNPGEGIRGLENFQDYNEVSRPVSGARDLAMVLSETQSVQSCMVEKAFRSVTSRPISYAAIDLINRDADREPNEFEAQSFACAAEILNTEFNNSGQDVKSLFRELANLSLIRFRRP